MPWKATSAMDERVRFVMDAERQETSFAALCRRYGVSRQAGYEWACRYREEGVLGLSERSRARHTQAHATSRSMVKAIVRLRSKHPSWGPKKLRARLQREYRGLVWPAVSTIGSVLAQRGLVVARRPRFRVAAMVGSLRACDEANTVWGIDFKGWFRTGDGRRCEPLSLSDLATRYVLRLQAVPRTSFDDVWPLLEAAFREYGLPVAIRSDNGTPFASSAPGGLSRLAVKLIKLGVVPERIAPGKPQQNGRHERLHLSVKLETANPPAANLRAQQRRFDRFQRMFNEERPHEALKLTPPAEHYQPSERVYTGRLREPVYDAECDVRRVRQGGELRWRGKLIFLTEALAGEPVAITQIADNDWRLSYATVDLGDRKSVV